LNGVHNAQLLTEQEILFEQMVKTYDRVSNTAGKNKVGEAWSAFSTAAAQK